MTETFICCTCGLHVHVNRDAFGDTDLEQEEVIARILFFVENHWNELLRFSRRTRDQMEQWSARYGRKDDPKAVLDSAKKELYQRYKCVNLTNYSTIEFRMFRGTLKLNTLIATLQAPLHCISPPKNLSRYKQCHVLFESTWHFIRLYCTFSYPVFLCKTPRDLTLTPESCFAPLHRDQHQGQVLPPQRTQRIYEPKTANLEHPF